MDSAPTAVAPVAEPQIPKDVEVPNNAVTADLQEQVTVSANATEVAPHKSPSPHVTAPDEVSALEAGTKTILITNVPDDCPPTKSIDVPMPPPDSKPNGAGSGMKVDENADINLAPTTAVPTDPSPVTASAETAPAETVPATSTAPNGAAPTAETVSTATVSETEESEKVSGHKRKASRWGAVPPKKRKKRWGNKQPQLPLVGNARLVGQSWSLNPEALMLKQKLQV